MSAAEYLKYGLIRAIVNTSLYVRRSAYLSPDTQPNFTKSYPCRPNLFPCRVFLPSELKSNHGKFPLVIRVHGGGFLVNNPAADDPIARHLADNAQCIVVSIDYSKAPQNRFPIAYEDVIAQVLAVIQDDDLPVVLGSVVLCGSSAGANLLLAAAQDARLRPKVTGVIAIYPVVDFVPTGDAKMATRPDPSVPDFIGDGFADVIRLYLDPADETPLTDTRLSPAYFASRESLPPNVLMIGAEHDLFCHEDEQMAEKLAGEGANKVERDGGWRAPGVQWFKVHGQRHAFDNFPAKDAREEKVRQEAVENMYSAMVEWLSDVLPREK